MNPTGVGKSNAVRAGLTFLLLMSAAYLTYRVFLVPTIGVSDWSSGQCGEGWRKIRMPFYEYITVVPRACFKGSLIVPENVDDYGVWLKADGCFKDIIINDKAVLQNECSTGMKRQQVYLNVAPFVEDGTNAMFVEISQDGGTTRFEIENLRYYNLVRFVILACVLAVAVPVITGEKRHALHILILSLILVHLVSPAFPIAWGFDFLNDYSMDSKLFLVSVLLFVMHPVSQNILTNLLFLLAQSVKEPMRRLASSTRRIRFPLVSVCFFLLFWFLRTGYSLGDSGFVGAIPVDERHMFFHTAPLTALISTQFYNLLRFLGIAIDSYSAFALLSCILGAGFIYAMLVVSDELGRNKTEKLTIFGLVATSYFMQLFFGYIEFSPSLYFWMSVYLLSSVLCLKGKGSPVLPSLALGIAISAHVSAAFLFPSLIALYLLRIRRPMSTRWLKDFAAIMVPILAYLGVFFGYVIFTRGHCTSGFFTCVADYVNGLHGSDPGLLMSMGDILSPWRIEQMINELVLIAPAASLVLLFALLFGLKEIDFKNKMTLFVVVSTVLFLVRTVTAQTGLGLPQDWDVISPVGLWLTTLAALLLIRMTRDDGTLRYWSIALITTQLLIHTAPLIVINSSL